MTSIGLTALLLLLVMAPVAVLVRRKRRRITLAYLVVIAAAGGIFGARFLPAGADLVEPRVAQRPLQVHEDGYVGSQSCQACHPREYASWYDSYHRTMTQVASVDTVIADMDGVERTVYGHDLRFEQRGDQLWMHMADPRWQQPGPAPMVQRRIVMTTGSHHQQMLWYATGESRKIGLVPLVWVRDQQDLIPFHSVLIKPPTDQWDWGGGQWNISCIRCHATRGRARFETPAMMLTDAAELGIACEACHGPAARHVEANRDPIRRYRLHLTDRADRTIVQPQRLDHRRASEVCGQCHSFSIHATRDEEVDWYTDGYRYQPGDTLEDTRYLVRGFRDRLAEPVQRLKRAVPTVMEDLFWSDGMIRVSGREFTGMRENGCFKYGEMSCMSCHRLHQSATDHRSRDAWRDDLLETRMRSNEACLQCHEELRAEPQLTAHTHHATSSDGSLCYNCHMAHTTTGLLKGIRSHQIEQPNIPTTLDTGRPNACNLCHLDQTLAWTSRHLQSWYGQPEAPLGDDHRELAASIVWALTGDAGQRAILADAFGRDMALRASGSDWIAPVLAQLLDDPYDSVRIIANRSLGRLEGFQEFRFDPVGPRDGRPAATRRATAMWLEFNGGWPKLDGDPTHLTGDQIQGLWARKDTKRVELRE